jgi:hypothetical protein
MPKKTAIENNIFFFRAKLKSDDCRKSNVMNIAWALPMRELSPCRSKDSDGRDVSFAERPFLQGRSPA